MKPKLVRVGRKRVNTREEKLKKILEYWDDYITQEAYEHAKWMVAD